MTDYAELCERLRADADTWAETRDHEGPELYIETLERQAAAAIERLSAENEALRGAARPFADAYYSLPSRWGDHETHWQEASLHSVTVGDLRAIAATLKGADHD
jgi:hypothetical protein